MDAEPQLVVEKVCKAVPVVLGTLALYGLRCSLGPSKSAVLFGLKHRSMSAVLKKVKAIQFTREGMFLEVHVPGYGLCAVPIVKQYKHVGVVTVSAVHNSVDPMAHVNKAAEAFRKLAANVIGNRDLPFSARSKFALIPEAKLLASAFIWYNLSSKTLKALDTFHNKLHRCLNLGFRYYEENKLTNAQFFEKFPHRNVLAAIRGRRLRELMRLVLHAPPELCHVLAEAQCSETSYIGQLIDDLEWLCQSSSFPEELAAELGAPREFPDKWFTFINNHSSRFKNRIKTVHKINKNS